jgi:hypothetical protein
MTRGHDHLSTILSIDNAELAYGLHPLLDRASLTVTRRANASG